MSRSKSRGKRRCYICNSDKHLKRECPEKRKKKGEHSFLKGQGNVSQEESCDGYDSAEVLVVSKNSSMNGWILDSGCSYHMTPHKEYFSSIEMRNMGVVQLGDDRPCEIMGQGKVTLSLDNGTEVVLENVRYIPKLTRNLISLGTFERAGYVVSLKGGKTKVIKGSMVMLTRTRGENNIYLLDGCVAGGVNVNVSNKGVNASRLWHKRLGHISDQGLVELKKQ